MFTSLASWDRFNAQENYQKTDWIFEDIFQETNVTLSMLSTNPLFHTLFFRDVLAQCRFSQSFPVIIRHFSSLVFGTIFSSTLSVRIFLITAVCKCPLCCKKEGSWYYHLIPFEQVLKNYYFRFLSWAFHIFAYDLAYEPDGWPWRPVSVRHIKHRFNFHSIPNLLLLWRLSFR